MILRKVDTRLRTCLNDLIETLQNCADRTLPMGLELLTDTDSYLNQADRIRKDISMMADPDALDAIAALDTVFRETSQEVVERFDQETADDICYEISRIRDYLGIDRRKRKTVFSGRAERSR